jgi:hypothetical protein
MSASTFGVSCCQLGSLCTGAPIRPILRAADGSGIAMKQTTFKSLAWSGKGKVTRRELFLAKMDAMNPGRGLIKLIQPHSSKAAMALSRCRWRGCCASTSYGIGSTCRIPQRRTICMTRSPCGALPGSSWSRMRFRMSRHPDPGTSSAAGRPTSVLAFDGI